MLKTIRSLVEALIDEVGFCIDNDLDVAVQSLRVLKETEKYMSKDLKVLWQELKESVDRVNNEKN